LTKRIEIAPHHHTHPSPYLEIGKVSFQAISLIAGLICIDRCSYGKYPMPVSGYGEGV